MTESNERYISFKAPDKEALSALLMKAKGPNRSLRKFAEEIGINVSTLSRIATGKITGVPSIDTIKGIAKHADPESGVTFNMLLQAAGLVRAGAVNENFQKFYNAVMSIIVNELLLRNYHVKNVYRRNSMTTLDSILGRCFLDLSLQTDALGKENATWLFDFWTRRESDKEDDAFLDRIRQWLLMYTGMYAYNEGSLDRLSVVLTEDDCYRRLLKYLKGYNTSLNISVILVDLSTERVVEEYVIKHSQPKPVFYQIADPMISNDNGLKNLMDTAEITLNMNTGNESGGSE